MEVSLKDGQKPSVWACPRCTPRLSEKDFWARMARLRYVEHRCKTYGQLCAYDIQLERERLDLEEIMDPNAGCERAKRVRAAVKKLERIHGKKYLHLISDAD